MSKYRLLLVAGVTVAFLVASVLFVLWWRPAIRVTLINESSHAINDLHITQRFAGLEYVPTLAPGEQVVAKFAPSRGAGIRISYRNSQSELEVQEADAYARGGGTESITLRIKESGITMDRAK